MKKIIPYLLFLILSIGVWAEEGVSDVENVIWPEVVRLENIDNQVATNKELNPHNESSFCYQFGVELKRAVGYSTDVTSVTNFKAYLVPGKTGSMPGYTLNITSADLEHPDLLTSQESLYVPDITPTYDIFTVSELESAKSYFILIGSPHEDDKPNSQSKKIHFRSSYRFTGKQKLTLRTPATSLIKDAYFIDSANRSLYVCFSGLKNGIPADFQYVITVEGEKVFVDPQFSDFVFQVNLKDSVRKEKVDFSVGIKEEPVPAEENGLQWIHLPAPDARFPQSVRTYPEAPECQGLVGKGKDTVMFRLSIDDNLQKYYEDVFCGNDKNSVSETNLPNPFLKLYIEDNNGYKTEVTHKENLSVNESVCYEWWPEEKEKSFLVRVSGLEPKTDYRFFVTAMNSQQFQNPLSEYKAKARLQESAFSEPIETETLAEDDFQITAADYCGVDKEQKRTVSLQWVSLAEKFKECEIADSDIKNIVYIAYIIDSGKDKNITKWESITENDDIRKLFQIGEDALWGQSGEIRDNMTANLYRIERSGKIRLYRNGSPVSVDDAVHPSALVKICAYYRTRQDGKDVLKLLNNTMIPEMSGTEVTGVSEYYGCPLPCARVKNARVLAIGDCQLFLKFDKVTGADNGYRIVYNQTATVRNYLNDSYEIVESADSFLVVKLTDKKLKNEKSEIAEGTVFVQGLREGYDYSNEKGEKPALPRGKAEPVDRMTQIRDYDFIYAQGFDFDTVPNGNAVSTFADYYKSGKRIRKVWKGDSGWENSASQSASSFNLQQGDIIIGHSMGGLAAAMLSYEWHQQADSNELSGVITVNSPIEGLDVLGRGDSEEAAWEYAKFVNQTKVSLLVNSVLHSLPSGSILSQIINLGDTATVVETIVTCAVVSADSKKDEDSSNDLTFYNVLFKIAKHGSIYKMRMEEFSKYSAVWDMLSTEDIRQPSYPMMDMRKDSEVIKQYVRSETHGLYALTKQNERPFYMGHIVGVWDIDRYLKTDVSQTNGVYIKQTVNNIYISAFVLHTALGVASLSVPPLAACFFSKAALDMIWYELLSGERGYAQVLAWLYGGVQNINEPHDILIFKKDQQLSGFENRDSLHGRTVFVENCSHMAADYNSSNRSAEIWDLKKGVISEMVEETQENYALYKLKQE